MTEREFSQSDIDRFWRHVNHGGLRDHCLLWNKAKNKNGYGVFSIRGRTILAHRAAMLLLNGWLPEVTRHGLRLFVLHKCDNPACVNPHHLMFGTQADNLRDMRLKGRAAPSPGALKTHCPQGHAYNSANTRVHKGKRICRQCDRDRNQHPQRKQQTRNRMRNRRQRHL
jgi:hypothetical protein